MTGEIFLPRYVTVSTTRGDYPSRGTGASNPVQRRPIRRIPKSQV